METDKTELKFQGFCDMQPLWAKLLFITITLAKALSLKETVSIFHVFYQ